MNHGQVDERDKVKNRDITIRNLTGWSEVPRSLKRQQFDFGS